MDRLSARRFPAGSVASMSGWLIAAYEAYKVDVAIALVVAVTIYGSFAFVPGFHIDDELTSVYGYVGAGISLGRWGISLIRVTLIPGPVNGYFSSFFFILALAFVAVLFSATLNLSRLGRRGATVLYIAFPQFCYDLEFHMQADVIPIGYALAIASFLLFVIAYGSTGYRKLFTASSVIALQVFALSIYQPIALIFPALCSLHLLKHLLRGDRIATLVRFAGAPAERDTRTALHPL